MVISAFLGIRMPPEELASLKQLGEQHQTSMSEEARRAIAAYLAAHDGEPPTNDDERAGRATQRVVPAPPALGTPAHEPA